MKNVILFLLVGAFLVGDKGIVTPEPQLMSIPSSAQVREVEPAVEHSQVRKEEEAGVEAYVEWNGERQTRDASDGAGFVGKYTVTEL